MSVCLRDELERRGAYQKMRRTLLSQQHVSECEDVSIRLRRKLASSCRRDELAFDEST